MMVLDKEVHQKIATAVGSLLANVSDTAKTQATKMVDWLTAKMDGHLDIGKQTILQNIRNSIYFSYVIDELWDKM